MQRDTTKHDLLEKQHEAWGKQNAWHIAYENSVLPYWDAVFCDLLMPAGFRAQSEEREFVGQQDMVVGWALALTAAKNGAKYVAVVTEMDYYSCFGLAMLDPFHKHFFTIDGARVLMTNFINLVGIEGTECACEKCSGSDKLDGYECPRCNGTGVDHKDKGKDWGKTLKALLSDDKEYSPSFR